MSSNLTEDTIWSRSPIGRGNRLKIYTVWIRIPSGLQNGKHVLFFNVRVYFIKLYLIFISMRYKHTKEALTNAVEKSLSIANVCRELGVKACGGNYKTVKAKIEEFQIDITHFTGAAWNQGVKFKPFGKKYELVDVLIENSPYKSSTKLKERLFKEGLKTEKCEVCGISEWMDKKITLELDHINGNNTDNRLVNLCVLCPNCHSQTPTFRNNKR